MDGHFEATEELDLEGLLMQEGMNTTMAAAAADDNAPTTFSFDNWWPLHLPEVPQGFDDSDHFITSLFADPPTLPCHSPQDQALGAQAEKMLPEQVQKRQQDEEQEEEEQVEGEGESEAKKNNGNEGTSRNLVFERQRRKRLNQQLLTLRSLVPNITKMDKRSILIDALAYLQNVLQQIDKEMEKPNLPNLPKSSSFASCSSGEDSSTIVEVEAPPLQGHTQEYHHFASLPAISKIEADMVGDERFILKIWCNKREGTVGLVQRATEMLGLQVTCASVEQFDNANMLTTTFLRAKKKGGFTVEKLLKKVRTNATELGLVL
ncbi:transcription factor bHLH35-like [Macadamia integrifolia]|uniref:transcription factor bHLH35-like n=1 Tax=Macadamia integrifolia TaxID=60698 RepID=UPI001C4EE13A|nr:transcription factor bHLH35-like [Macadamia integrifolia]